MTESTQPEVLQRWLALNIPAELIGLEEIISQIKSVTDDYHRPSITDMASPALVEALSDAAKQDKKLAEIMNAFLKPESRVRMQGQAVKFIVDLISFQIQRENTVHVAVFGDRGTGKSELATMLSLLMLAVYFHEGMSSTILGMSRSASIANWILGRATEQKRAMILQEDESDREYSTGAQKELRSLIQNMDTQRILRHSLILLMINLDYMGNLVARCDFALRAIFSDWDNRINWCILYVKDLRARVLIPKAIVGFPLHRLEDLRTRYKAWKYGTEFKLSVSGGSEAAARDIVILKAEELAKYAKAHGLSQHSARRLLEILRDDIGTGSMVIDQQKDAVLKAQRIMAEASIPPPGHEPEFEWESDFSWKEEMLTLMQNHPDFRRYADVFLASEVNGLSAYKNARAFEKVTHQKKTANEKWLNRMRKDQQFQGWLQYERSIMHEKFVKQKLEKAHWKVTAKPHFEVGGVDYEEDLYAEKGKHKAWINCKCGSGNKTYVAKDNYLTTYLLANQADKEAYILYLDLETNVHDVFRPEQRISVGSGRSSVHTTDEARGAHASTPLLLLEAMTAAKAEPRTRPAKAKPMAKKRPASGSKRPERRPEKAKK